MFSLDSYRALRESAGVVDRSLRGTISVAGADRAAFLQGLLTNDITALAGGRGCYAAHLTPQGRMVSDMAVLNLGETILLDVPQGLNDSLLQRFQDFVFTEDVQLVDETERFDKIGVHGPRSHDVLHRALQGGDAVPTPEQLAAFEEYQNGLFEFSGNRLVVARTGELGDQGFNVYIDRQDGPALRDRLRSAGAVEITAATADVRRIEAGRPLFHADMDENTIPLEAGIEARAISFTKGCYVGQEVIVRVVHRGHGRVARRLVGLMLDDAGVPSHGDLIQSGGKQIGMVTSAAQSPSLGRPIALGYVQRDFIEPGTLVEVTHGLACLQATVARLPFRIQDSGVRI